jgi:pseudouridine-5'-phosphate glycosidase
MRCESIFILSLLLFLLMAAGKLGLSYRSRVFGISFGFGIMAASDLVVSAAFLHFGRNMMTSTISVVTTSASLFTLMVWSAYFVQREPARQAATLNASSRLARLNEIAMALGQSGTRIPVVTPVPARSDFFLQDVEKVVDRILIKNSLHVAS